MIVKGKIRSGPAQLAAYLLRQDGSERPALLHLDYGDDDLAKAFIEWDSIGELTRGEKTLYHAQIAPESRYAMTPEQWKRAAEILAEELGMGDHPRAIVLHDGNGKPHAHVVFQRVNTDTMTLWDNGFNYVKHEQASKRMAEEFGHEIIPGKHAKRDREKQPEFPRAKLTTEEAQQEKRTGLSKEARVAEVTALYRSADSGPALKAALEDAGYVRAKGERGYVVVDQSGGQSVLTRNTGLKKKEMEAFMKGVPLDSLPSVEEAKRIQKGRAEQGPAVTEAPAPSLQTEKPTTAPAPATKEQGVEASKFVQPRRAEPAQPAPKPQDPKIAALLKSLAERQEQEAVDRRDAHARELEQAERALDRELKEKLDSFEAIQQEQRKALKERHAEKREGIGGLIDQYLVRRRFNAIRQVKTHAA